jgi:hypothetical protein
MKPTVNAVGFSFFSRFSKNELSFNIRLGGHLTRRVVCINRFLLVFFRVID